MQVPNAPPMKTATGMQHPIFRPNLRCLPDLVSGIPSFRESVPLKADTPVARLQEKENPYFFRRPIMRALLNQRSV